MFGKGGGALSTWIKEFFQLVFIQTLQAFIYALVISFIVKILGNSSLNGTMSGDDHNTAVGLIAVVALTAIFKVEDMARKIFGFGGTKADHGNAIASIAKTGFALKVGSKVLDNGKKLIGGAGAVMGAHAKGVKARKNYLKDLEAYNKDNNLLDNGEKKDEKSKNSSGIAAIGGDSGEKSPGQRQIDSKKRDQKIDLLNAAKVSRLKAQEQSELKKKHIEEAKRKAELARNINDKNEDGSINAEKRDQKLALMEQAQEERKAAEAAGDKEKQYIAQAKSQLARSRSIDDTLTTPATVSIGKTGGSTSGSSGNTKAANSLPKDYYQKMRQFENNYNKELDNIKKQKREGYKNIAKGLVETGAATVGFATGAIIGGADGNLDEAIRGGITGMGLGDSLGSGAVDLSAGVIEFAENRAKSAANMIGEYSKEVKAAYDEKIKEANNAMSDAASTIDADTNQAIQNINDSARRVAEQATRSTSSKTTSQVSRSTKVKIGAASAVKGLKSTAQNHSIRSLDSRIKVAQNLVEARNRSTNTSRADDKDWTGSV